MKRALVRFLAVTASGAALSLGLVGLAHTGLGHALNRVAHGRCPFGYDKPMSPAERERQASHFAAAHRGSSPAMSRPALGFVLDRTTRSEVAAAMVKNGVSCVSAKGLSDLTCNGVPSSALGGAAAPARNLWLTFGAHEQLLSLVAISRDANAQPISAAFLATERTLEHDAGAVGKARGNPAPEALAAGALRQASAEFRFSDYYAVERAAKLGDGFVLTEEYRSLLD
jgi:hypothetical protein